MNKDVRVASVQFQHVHGNKTENMKTVRHFVQKAAQVGIEIICFPEMCITGYWGFRSAPKNEVAAIAESVPGGRSAEELLHLSKTHRMTIGAGLIELGDDGELYNSYFVAMPDGRHACHRKIHCFINEHMSSGNRYTVFDTPHGCRVGVLICYDNNIVENARITALLGADVLMAPHQTGGCESRSPGAMGLIDPRLWENRETNPEAIEEEFRGMKGRGWLMRWLPSRAHDNGMFVMFSNGVGLDDNEVRTGNAMILDPYGRILAETSRAQDDMVVTTLKADALTLCTGRRWLKGRKPDLYGPLTEMTGNEVDPRSARFSKA